VRVAARWVPVTLVLGACLGGVLLQARVGEYAADAGPAVAALIGGHLHRFFQVQPLMGSFAVLARAPFALAAKLAGAGEKGEYRAGTLACLAAAAALGLWLVRLRGARPGALVLVPVLAIATPASIAAVHTGHPEEILGGVLCVAAVLLADRRPFWAAVVLGLAIATKQWALVAIAPTVLAAPSGRRVRLVAIAAGVAGLLTVPLVLGDFSMFSHTTQEAATSSTVTARATIWFLLARPDHLHLHLPAGLPTHFTVYTVPSWVMHSSHPLIVLVSPLLGFVAWRRRGDPLALLALVLLLRCVLDPVDNEYYHEPFLLALLAFEIVRRREVRGVPLLTVFSCAGLWLTFDRLDQHGAVPALTNAVYLAWTLAAMVPLARAQVGGPVETPSSGASLVPAHVPQRPFPAACAAAASRMSVSAYSPRTPSKK
jgi:hypothetical protein